MIKRFTIKKSNSQKSGGQIKNRFTTKSLKKNDRKSQKFHTDSTDCFLQISKSIWVSLKSNL